MTNAYERFMQSVYTPMRQQLVQNGFTELTTEEEVVNKMDGLTGSALIVVNSVCGCAAGQARPAVIEAVADAEVKPDHLLTVFAGQDKEATAKMRSYFADIPASSPSIALWKDGEVASFIPREVIEDHDKEMVKTQLIGLFDQFLKA